MTIKKIISILIIFLLFSCSLSKQYKNIFESFFYDKETDITHFRIEEDYEMNLSGNWRIRSYRNNTNQYYLSNSTDNATLIISAFDIKKYAPSKDTTNPLDKLLFLEEYYIWDTKNLSKQYDITENLIEEDTIQNYILCRLGDEKAKRDIIILYGIKYNHLFSIIQEEKNRHYALRSTFVTNIFQSIKNTRLEAIIKEKLKEK